MQYSAVIRHILCIHIDNIKPIQIYNCWQYIQMWNQVFIVIDFLKKMRLKMEVGLVMHIHMYSRRQQKVNVSFVKTKPERRTVLFRLSLQFVPKCFYRP